MTKTVFFWTRYALAPWLATVVLLISACESPRLPSLFQADKIKTSQAPAKISTPQAPLRPLPDVVAPQKKYEPMRPAPTVKQSPQPSLSSYLYNRRTKTKGAYTPIPKSSTVRVALLLPLSGPSAKLGAAMQNAAQLAMFAFPDDRFELLVHDTRGTPEGAIDAVGLAIGDGAYLVLGPLLRASVRAVAPAARAANVTVIAFSSDKSVAGQGVFTMGFHPEAE
ncbi:MAG TPA: hypothetical protein ENI79_06090, partial [Rhodospirillales bacterium]|nr:hypothetical protein [Rhodospirillales bacterium]